MYKEDNPFAQKENKLACELKFLKKLASLAFIALFPIVNFQIFTTVVFFSSFNEISVMPHQNQGQNGQQGVWMYQCIHCKKNFPSSQAIAGHTKGHFRDGWVKGTPQSKVFVLFSEYQQQQGSITDSSIPEKHVFSAATSDTDLTDAHRLPIGDVQNSRSLVVRPPSPASSSRQPRIPRHHLRLRDLKILARLRARLTREEQEVILRLLDSAMEQAKQSRKKSTEAEVIPNRNSEAAAAIGTTDTDTDVSSEESDDESKNM